MEVRDLEGAERRSLPLYFSLSPPSRSSKFGYRESTHLLLAYSLRSTREADLSFFAICRLSFKFSRYCFGFGFGFD